MSNLPTPSDSPVHIQPLHNPAQAALVTLPQAPLGNATNGPTNKQPMHGLGAKELLAKRMAKGHNPKFISPTDSLVTPVSQKLNAAKKKHFNKGPSRPMPQLFTSNDQSSTMPDEDEQVIEDDDREKPSSTSSSQDVKMLMDEENPF